MLLSEPVTCQCERRQIVCGACAHPRDTQPSPPSSKSRSQTGTCTRHPVYANCDVGRRRTTCGARAPQHLLKTNRAIAGCRDNRVVCEQGHRQAIKIVCTSIERLPSITSGRVPELSGLYVKPEPRSLSRTSHSCDRSETSMRRPARALLESNYSGPSYATSNSHRRVALLNVAACLPYQDTITTKCYSHGPALPTRRITHVGGVGDAQSGSRAKPPIRLRSAGHQSGVEQPQVIRPPLENKCHSLCHFMRNADAVGSVPRLTVSAWYPVSNP